MTTHWSGLPRISQLYQILPNSVCGVIDAPTVRHPAQQSQRWTRLCTIHTMDQTWRSPLNHGRTLYYYLRHGQHIGTLIVTLVWSKRRVSVVGSLTTTLAEASDFRFTSLYHHGTVEFFREYSVLHCHRYKVSHNSYDLESSSSSSPMRSRHSAR